MKRIFFDMDGTLTIYEKSIFIPSPADGDAPFMTPGMHSFTECDPQPRMVQAFNRLYETFLHDENMSVAILSSIPVGMMQAEHTLDKISWCKKFLTPELRVEDIYIVSGNKAEAVIETFGKMSEDDILIDDYRLVLDSWVKHGGKGIKCLNELNSNDIRFESISTKWSPDQIVDAIEKYAGVQKIREVLA